MWMKDATNMPRTIVTLRSGHGGRPLLPSQLWLNVAMSATKKNKKKTHQQGQGLRDKDKVGDMQQYGLV